VSPSRVSADRARAWSGIVCSAADSRWLPEKRCIHALLYSTAADHPESKRNARNAPASRRGPRAETTA
jgi:hypothetical protein